MRRRIGRRRNRVRHNHCFRRPLPVTHFVCTGVANQALGAEEAKQLNKLSLKELLCRSATFRSAHSSLIFGHRSTRLQISSTATAEPLTRLACGTLSGDRSIVRLIDTDTGHASKSFGLQRPDLSSKEIKTGKPGGSRSS